ncbi:hypothetical protein BH20VER2_BH20VER2_02510 [soil metagenome]|nr:hypothetical protein [Chthoniobacterales bacterium]
MDDDRADAADIPLLFPDPVIEFYMQKVDRAAIRRHLAMSVSERLQWLERQAQERRTDQSQLTREEPPAWPAKRRPIDMGVDPAWFAEAAAVPMLFPDPVIEEYMKDVDRGLIRESLKLSSEERFTRFAALMKNVHELRRSAMAAAEQSDESAG